MYSFSAISQRTKFQGNVFRGRYLYEKNIQCVQKVWKHPNKIETNDFRENAKTGELAFSKSFLLMVSVCCF
jgi:hypothetical protein